MTVLAGLACAGRAAAASRRGLVRWTNGLTLLLIVAYAVALWAMASKPI